ncbi:MAG TPA: hypothetical protein VMT28_02975 [Terriglobales bacterium]|jgi:hypothetical protein|nr:hypothetical protein [Terriglobales bacterium]
MRRGYLILLIGLLLGVAPLAPAPSAFAQELAKRLILKDGSYQLVTKYEVKGDRVRYLSAERNEWEEVPKDLVDWAATEQFEKDRAAGKPAPEAVELDKELEAERQAEELKTPQVAPGLRLPEDGGVMLLDTFQGQPQLVELQQQGGQVNKNMTGNILRATINPIASAKQTIELPGPHAKIQSHAALPSIYVNVEQQDKVDSASQQDSQGLQLPQAPQQPDQPWDRFHIVRVQAKGNKRVVGDIKIKVYGKVSQEQKMVETTSEQLTGGWVKVTPTAPLTPGEYAVVEMLGKEGMNLYVWDFAVNPAAPANLNATGARPVSSTPLPPPDSPKNLEKRKP